MAVQASKVTLFYCVIVRLCLWIIIGSLIWGEDILVVNEERFGESGSIL